MIRFSSLKTVHPAVLLLTLALVAPACGSGENPAIESKPGSSPSAAKEKQEHKTIDGKDVVVHGRATVETGAVSIEVGDSYFDPTVLTAKAGTQVTATLKREGQLLHNFTVPGQVDQELPPGSTQSVTFTFPQSGTLVFFCKYHRDAGMVGELTAT